MVVDYCSPGIETETDRAPWNGDAAGTAREPAWVRPRARCTASKQVRKSRSRPSNQVRRLYPFYVPLPYLRSPSHLATAAVSQLSLSLAKR